MPALAYSSPFFSVCIIARIGINKELNCVFLGKTGILAPQKLAHNTCKAGHDHLQYELNTEESQIFTDFTLCAHTGIDQPWQNLTGKQHLTGSSL